MGFGALRTAVMSICIGLALQVFALQPGMASDRSAAVPSVELKPPCAMKMLWCRQCP